MNPRQKTLLAAGWAILEDYATVARQSGVKAVADVGELALRSSEAIKDVLYQHSSWVTIITEAYEGGVGNGQQARSLVREVENPWAEGMARIAWQKGYEVGKAQPENPLAEHWLQQYEWAFRGWEECKKVCDALRDDLARREAPAQADRQRVPDHVRQYAKYMQKDGYRGPLAWAKEIIDWVAAAPEAPAQSEKRVPQGLKARCSEILDWQKTGVLKGDELRSYASAKYGDDRHALQLAEAETAREAYRLIASASESPAQFDWSKFPGYLIDRYEGEVLTEELLQQAASEIAAPEAPAQAEQHPDNVAVDRFAQAMKAKLAEAREKGRSGWENCPPEELSRMLREHVEKGDTRDVANFCAFLWNRRFPITTGPAAPAPNPELVDLCRAIVDLHKSNGCVLTVQIEQMAELLEEPKKGGAK